MSDRYQALAALNAWLSEHGQDTSASTKDAWNISEYRDARVFSPAGGRRSNVLYLVLGDSVAWFSPARTTLEEAYSVLSATPDTNN